MQAKANLKPTTTRRLSERTANTNQTLLTDDETGTPEPVEHSEAWLAAFKTQHTPDMIEAVYAYAASRAAWVAKHTGTSDKSHARELVTDAIGDTFLGVVTWDPNAVPLAIHLKRVIRSRTSHEIERLATFPHVRIEHTPAIEFEEEVSGAMACQRAGSSGELTECIAATMAALRTLAADDDHVTQLLDAYSDGAIERRDVMRVTGMTSDEYSAARRRMLRLVPKLPEDVRELVALAFAS